MSIESALTLIESVKDYCVLFVGDTILDEYHYVRPLGKSPKEYLIPVEFHSKEVFHGGVDAAANHCRAFCKQVEVASVGLITRKIRMIDNIYKRKLFEVHYNGERIARQTALSDRDVLVIADFGHGAITDVVLDNIRNEFVAVACQTNSSNIGFNLITKYARADYIVIDEPEARLAAADRDSPIEDVILKLAKDRCGKFVVTLGHHGAIGWEKGRFFHTKAMSREVTDTMGAGDAFFAVTAPMAKTGSIEDLLLIGNAAGALKCGIIGHRESVTKEHLIEFLRTHGPR